MQTCDVKLDREPLVTMRSHLSTRTGLSQCSSNNGTFDANNRLSEVSMGSSE